MWILGTPSSGNGTAGTEREGSDAPRTGVLGMRKNAAIGAAYMSRSTSRPRPDHQYLMPLDLSAISPYGWAVAIDAYDAIPTPLKLPSPPPRIETETCTSCARRQ